MVSVNKRQGPRSRSRPVTMALGAGAAILFLFVIFNGNSSPSSLRRSFVKQQASMSTAKTVVLGDSNLGSQKNGATDTADDKQQRVQCPYMHISDLTPEEILPTQGKRHMITPPQGGLLHLVCCQTTQGPFNTLVHEKWAPLGAKRFLEMVTTGYFTAGVPLMRCIKGFLCQFGLNNNPLLSKKFKQTIQDDTNWLPEGPTHRQNAEGVKRFALGYMAYAGGGKNTRDMQLIVSLDNVPSLAGGSPWEVPWGELVGSHSFETLAKFYTGYGEDGPSQGSLWSEGMTEEARKKFPKLDYITDCALVDQQIQKTA